MKYALTGSHGVGKTTIINELYDYLEESKIKPIINSSNARKIALSGRTINDTGDDIVQMIVECSHVSKFCEDNWFADRSVLDGYAYTKYLHATGKVSDEVMNVVGKLMSTFVKLYDNIFYIPVEFDMIKDGVRKEDSKFQKNIDNIIFNTMYDNNVHFNTIRGSVTERVEKIKSIIHPHFDF
jgi:predicted ATPase